MAVRVAGRRLALLSDLFQTSGWKKSFRKILNGSSSCSSHFASKIRCNSYATAVQPKPDAADVPTITVPSDLPRNERYIPVTRKALVRSFLEDSSLLTGSERDNFAEFAAALDAHIYQKFYQMLDEMKVHSKFSR